MSAGCSLEDEANDFPIAGRNPRRDAGRGCLARGTKRFEVPGSGDDLTGLPCSQGESHGCNASARPQPVSGRQCPQRCLQRVAGESFALRKRRNCGATAVYGYLTRSLIQTRKRGLGPDGSGLLRGVCGRHSR